MAKKMRAAGYPRVSNENLKDSPTLDSQEQAIRAYAAQEGFMLEDEHVYPEAHTAYMKPFRERPQFMQLLAAARRHEFDVVIVNEYSRLSRRQIEQAVIIDLLEKAGVKVLSVTEKFEDSAIGHFMRSVYAFLSEVEREKIVERTTRGKLDRAKNGNLTGQGYPTYGYAWVDTKWEQKALYELNNSVIYVDEEGVEWTEVLVVVFIFSLALKGISTKKIAFTLTQKGIPTSRGKPYWSRNTVHQILTNPYYIGQASVFRYQRESKKVTKRQSEEQILLPSGIVPPIIDEDTFHKVQRQLDVNKQASMRNNKHPNTALLRGGFVRCGMCGHALRVQHNGLTKGKYYPDPDYRCTVSTGREEKAYHHMLSIRVPLLDAKVWEFAVVHITNPELVRSYIDKLRENKSDGETIAHLHEQLDQVRTKIKNLVKLAVAAQDDEIIEGLKANLQIYEKQKREIQTMLLDMEEDEEETEKLQAEIDRFEAWVMQVQPKLGDPSYQPDFEEKLLACRVLGIHATIFPEGAPQRMKIELGPPAIMPLISKSSCTTVNKSSRIKPSTIFPALGVEATGLAL